MKFATSYFYQIRFFKPNMIPISTAKWDPKWYHSFGPQTHRFFDKRRILNGCRINALSPINDNCRGTPCPHTPELCEFLKEYAEQLKELDFTRIVAKCQLFADEAGITDPVFVFMVHEAPTKACSERASIQQFVRDNGYECDELSYPIQ